MSGRLVGVGVGPGDPDLLTIKGREALRRADIVFVPVAAEGGSDREGPQARVGGLEEEGPQARVGGLEEEGPQARVGGLDEEGPQARVGGLDEEGPQARVGGSHDVGDELGYAERVVRAHVPYSTPVRRLAFDLDPSNRQAAWSTAGEAVAAVVGEGETAAFATIGDPNVYSTFSRIARVVRTLAPGTTIETVPGITAMQDLASRSGTTLAEGDERLALLPFTAGETALRDALDRFDTVVCYKGGRRLPDLLRVIREAGRMERLVYGARLGLAGEEIRHVPFLPRGSGPYLSTVIVTRP